MNDTKRDRVNDWKKINNKELLDEWMDFDYGL